MGEGPPRGTPRKEGNPHGVMVERGIEGAGIVITVTIAGFLPPSSVPR